jgi:hypothetical protein
LIIAKSINSIASALIALRFTPPSSCAGNKYGNKMFTFSPLQGAQSESTASQSLLELDGGVKVLIDLGWDESFETEKLQELEK